MSNKKHNLSEFEAVHGQSKIQKLQHDVDVEKKKVEALAGQKEKVHFVEPSKSNIIKFGLIGDTHIGSLYCRIDLIKAFYETCATSGIDTVLHAGDIFSGWKVFRGHEFELRDVGFDAQLARLVSEYPDNGITTRFITGNHDSSFTNSIGIDVGAAIAKDRSDLIHVGQDQGRISFHNAEGQQYNVMLLHPGGGSSYALSYRPQKLIESLEGGTKPHLIGIGHYHKAEMMPSYRNVTGIQAGTFETQTPFMARQGLAAHVGGWIIEVVPGKTYNRVKAEFIACY